MQIVNIILGKPLGWIMYLCYELVHRYWLTILLFTLISKLILFPIALMLQKNSIKMVKLQPEIKQIKRLYAGDKERINDEQFLLYEREEYNPAIGLLPTFLQVIIILGLIQVVYHPLEHLFHLDKNLIAQLISFVSSLNGVELPDNIAQMRVIESIQNPATVESIRNLGLISSDVFGKIQALDMRFIGLNLASIPNISHPDSLWTIALGSGLSSLLMCVIQNKKNVLQKEQNWIEKWGVSIVVIAFGFYFAFLVPGAIGLYWIFSNILATLQIYILNRIMDPKKYIDYESRDNENEGAAESDEIVMARREQERLLEARSEKDMDRFYATKNKLVVFYSEKSGFYDYFKDILESLTKKTKIRIHYLTSDPKDAMFERNIPNVEVYYVADKSLGKVFASLDSDIVVTTTPDLNTFHIKRSVVRKDIEYIYVPHDLGSEMTFRKGALDHYDTIFCSTKYMKAEQLETEKMHNLKPRNLVEFGYGLLDDMIRQHDALIESGKRSKKPMVLIAPSYQKGNIVEAHLDSILPQITNGEYKVVVRPHPQFVKRNPGLMEEIVAKYEDQIGEDLVFETDYSNHDSIYLADVLITDWSGTAIEFACVTRNPALFINTPMKVINPEYIKYQIQPIEITMRKLFGIALEESEVAEKTADTIGELLTNREKYRKTIDSFIKENIYNPGRCGEVGAKYIISRLREKRSKK